MNATARSSRTEIIVTFGIYRVVRQSRRKTRGGLTQTWIEHQVREGRVIVFRHEWMTVCVDEAKRLHAGGAKRTFTA